MAFPLNQIKKLLLQMFNIPKFLLAKDIYTHRQTSVSEIEQELTITLKKTYSRSYVMGLCKSWSQNEIQNMEFHYKCWQTMHKQWLQTHT